MTLRVPYVPLPYPPENYDRGHMHRVIRDVNTFMQQVQFAQAEIIPTALHYGVFESDADQTLSAADTATVVAFTDAGGRGVLLDGSPLTNLVVADTGVYQIDFTLNVRSTAASATTVYAWVAANGTPVAGTVTRVTLNATDQTAPLRGTCFYTLKEGEYLEVMWAASSTNVLLDAVTGLTFAPDVRSATAAVVQITR